MKIVVNTRLLIKNKLEGIGRFSFEVLKRIVKETPQHEFVFLFDRPFSSEYIFESNVKGLVAGPKARHPFLYYYWFNFVVPKVLRKEKADLFLSMDGILSLNTEVKQVAVIHDLNFEHFPQYLPFLTRKYYQLYFPRFAQIAQRIITVSEFSKNDIAKSYGIDIAKIEVSNNAASNKFGLVSDDVKIEIRNKYSGGNNYLIYVGSLNPRKNVKGVLSAFEKHKKTFPSNLKLLIVGESMWSKEQIANNNDVVYTGRLEDNELSKVLGASIGLCYVSFFEGFGIPILEAMKSGVPVITSDSSSMPEVTGDAAILVDPSSIDQISNAMNQLVSNNSLVEKLVSKGLEREKAYSWDKAADVVVESINRTVK